jgi:hypothetical protein
MLTMRRYLLGPYLLTCFVALAQAPAYKKVTVCASGCNYPLTDAGLLTAMTDAAHYQDHTACIPYIIEGTGSFPMSGVRFPPKTCRQFVEIRSSHGSHFIPGQRYNPAKDDAYAFGLQGAKLPGTPMFYTAGGTRYWRFRNVNFFADTKGGATYPVTSASWSAGAVTLTIGAAISGYSAVSINGIKPAGYNVGNIIVPSATATTVTFPHPVNPGPYVSGGTVTLLYKSSLSSFIQLGDAWDLNNFPDHIEIIQSGMQSAGDGEVSHAVLTSGSNISIIDSYLSGFVQYGGDGSAVIIEHGDNIITRNTYVSAQAEDVGMGGSLVAAGTTPRFMYWYGNKLTKEPWMNVSNGAGAPTKPCFQGNLYHDNAANADYVCAATSTTPVGSWNAMATLSTHMTDYPYNTMWPKNIWECKICQGVRLSGNSFGPIPAQSAQSALSILMNLVTQPYGGACTGGVPSPCANVPQPWTSISDVSITANRFDSGFGPFGMAYSAFHPCAAIDPATRRPYSQPCYNEGHHNIRFSNNLTVDVSDERNYCLKTPASLGTYCSVSAGCGEACGAVGQLGLNAAEHDIVIDHNTETVSRFSPSSGLILNLGANASGTRDSSGMIIVTNNIGPLGVQGFRGEYDIPTQIYNPQNGCGMEAMLQLYGGALDLHKNIWNTEKPAGQRWQSFSTGKVDPGCARSGTGTSIWPPDHAGGFSWTSILDTSTYKVTNPKYKGWGTDQRDPGADIDFVNWKTEHAIDGAPSPKLDYTIRSLIPTANESGRGVRIYFTAPSIEACTWELSLDPNRYASPIAVSSQVRKGRDGLAVWNAETLAAGKAYWARVTCHGDQLETMVNGDRAYVITAP